MDLPFRDRLCSSSTSRAERSKRPHVPAILLPDDVLWKDKKDDEMQRLDDDYVLKCHWAPSVPHSSKWHDRYNINILICSISGPLIVFPHLQSLSTRFLPCLYVFRILLV
jgi:hypothetical protein